MHCRKMHRQWTWRAMPQPQSGPDLGSWDMALRVFGNRPGPPPDASQPGGGAIVAEFGASSVPEPYAEANPKDQQVSLAEGPWHDKVLTDAIAYTKGLVTLLDSLTE